MTSCSSDSTDSESRAPCICITAARCQASGGGDESIALMSLMKSKVGAAYDRTVAMRGVGILQQVAWNVMVVLV